MGAGKCRHRAGLSSQRSSAHLGDPLLQRFNSLAECVAKTSVAITSGGFYLGQVPTKEEATKMRAKLSGELGELKQM